MTEKNNMENVGNSPNNIDNNISIYRDINVASELFIEKMFDLYGNFEDQLIAIVQNRNIYESANNSAYIPYIEVLKIYDLYKLIDGKDPEVSEALHATCLWNIYKNISGDDEDPTMFMDEIEDSKGGLKSKLNYVKIKNSLVRKYCIISYAGIMYIYVGNQFYSGVTAQERIEKDITKILECVGFSEHSKTKDIINDIVYNIRISTTKFKEFPFNKRSKNYIPVQNGVVVRKDLNVLLPPSPVWGFTYSLPVEFHKDIDTTEIRDYLHSLVKTEDEYKILLQIPSQGLFQNEFFQTTYLLTGDGQNGKSTYLNLNRRLLGSKNYTTISLQDLLESRFKIAEMDGKIMNMFSDLPSESLKATGKFKALSGSDEISAERKYGQPFQFVNRAVMVFSANEAPYVEDSSYAYWRRWEILDFPYKFKVDPDFEKKMFTPENLSGFLNLIIERMVDIEKNGLMRTKSVENVMNAWLKSSDNTLQFIDDMIKFSSGGQVPKNDVYEEYRSYCEDRFLIPDEINHTNLFKNLSKLGYKISRPVINGVKTSVVKGIEIKEKSLDVQMEF